MNILTLSLFLIMAESVWEWIHRLGGPGLILLGIADVTPFVSVPPGSVDIFVIVLSAHRHEWWFYYAFMATVGEVLGGYLAYRLAEKGGQKTLEKKIGKQRAEKIYKYFEKHGFITVFTGSILPPPFPFTFVLMAAGIMQYPRKQFLSAMTLGRGLRYFAVAYFGRIYGQQIISFFSRHYRPAMYFLIALAVAAGIGALVYFKWYRPKAQREERERGEQVQQFPVLGRHPEIKTAAARKIGGSA
ncbi:MAG TPA: VTT domain-containing protein [Candidatus Acidoferrum sp.]|nr:VTT domain-containing protein [Candidatus Acidoferrum sp.]